MVAKIFLAIYVSFIVGRSVADVGEISKASGEPFGWELPFAMAAYVLLPAALGYLAGREDGGHRE